MKSIAINKNELLKKRLSSLSVDNEEYWSFKNDSNREYCHGFFQYPAMMVPQLVRTLIDEVVSIEPEINNIGDPFAGSGTVLTESILKGKCFWGADINPLAILLCKVKAGPFSIDIINRKTKKLFFEISTNKSPSTDLCFKNIDKWFRKDVKESLLKIRECIKNEKSLWIRRFFWVALAETVRLTSNSRTSTFKLHTRTEKDIATRKNDVENVFKQTTKRNIRLLNNQYDILKKSGLIKNGIYINKVETELLDIRHTTKNNLCDLIITSPPYGDNATTVPYGQFSYLPLQWIDLNDISNNIQNFLIANTHSTDSASLGGSLKITNDEIESICALSSSLSRYTKNLVNEPKDRIQRVSSFIRDLNCSLSTILNCLNAGGIMVWVLGNRTVGGKEVPLDEILTELLENHGAKHIHTLIRSIHSKRIATKNNLSQTMSKERIVVMRKPSAG